MEDGKILQHIEALVAEEDRLYASANLSDADINRLHALKTELDQYWDFLRQRRALRNAGDDPAKAEIRGSGTVENYEQ